jgi:hypothetical protein
VSDLDPSARLESFGRQVDRMPSSLFDSDAPFAPPAPATKAGGGPPACARRRHRLLAGARGGGYAASFYGPAAARATGTLVVQ